MVSPAVSSLPVVVSLASVRVEVGAVVFGADSAFFVPAKYGVMPEILQSHLLSRGNGVLEVGMDLAAAAERDAARRRAA